MKILFCIMFLSSVVFSAQSSQNLNLDDSYGQYIISPKSRSLIEMVAFVGNRPEDPQFREAVYAILPKHLVNETSEDTVQILTQIIERLCRNPGALVQLTKGIKAINLVGNKATEISIKEAYLKAYSSQSALCRRGMPSSADLSIPVVSKPTAPSGNYSGPKPTSTPTSSPR